MQDSYLRKPTKKMPVRLRTMDGDIFKGYVFIAGDGNRIKDLLNFDAPFLAFQHASGEIEILNKALIARVMPLERPQSRPQERPQVSRAASVAA